MEHIFQTYMSANVVHRLRPLAFRATAVYQNPRATTFGRLEGFFKKLHCWSRVNLRDWTRGVAGTISVMFWPVSPEQ